MVHIEFERVSVTALMLDEFYFTGHPEWLLHTKIAEAKRTNSQGVAHWGCSGYRDWINS